MEDNKKGYTITITGRNKRREIHLSALGFNLGILLIMTSAFIFVGTCAYSIYSILHHQQNVAMVNEVQRAGEMQQEQILAVSKKAVDLSETLQNLAQQEQELRIQAGLNKPAREDKVEEEITAKDNNLISSDDEIPELEPIPLNSENLPIIENPPTEIKSEWTPPAPAAVEIPVQPETPVQSEWTPPAPVEPVQSEFTQPAPEPIQSEWVEPYPLNPPPLQSEWIPPAPNGQGGPVSILQVKDVKEALQLIEERVAIRLESLDDFQIELKQRREQMAMVMEVPVNSSTGEVFVDGGMVGDLSLDLSQFGGSPSTNPNMPSIWPTTGVVTSPYGLRWGGTDFHPGIDIANDMGTPIIATADGVVEYAGWNAGGYGNMVDINHGNGLMTRYGHASQVVVSAGQHVRRGQLIAYMGSTGFSTGPHVHYEVHVNGQRVNPISYL